MLKSLSVSTLTRPAPPGLRALPEAFRLILISCQLHTASDAGKEGVQCASVFLGGDQVTSATIRLSANYL